MKLDHIAIIMDGNRRWASANNLPSYEGHRKGAENLWNIIKNIQDFKLKFLTVFVFSTENWKRSSKEISFLMTLLNEFLDHTISKINDEINIRNNQFQKGEIISIEHLRNIDNNIELLKSQLKDENILQLEELSSQIKVLAKTISLIKK